MRIIYASVMVDDQERALRFYTEVLGFELKHNIPMGEHRWITVVNTGEPSGVELTIEPASHPAAAPFRDALMSDGIPWTAFGVEDVDAEFERLKAEGVEFTQPPTQMGEIKTAVFNDTCGNLIMIMQGAMQ